MTHYIQSSKQYLDSLIVNTFTESTENDGDILVVDSSTASGFSFTTPTASLGKYYCDDLFGSASSNNGIFAMTSVGTHAGASPQQQQPVALHSGITRIFNSAANVVAGYQSASAVLFQNLQINATNPATFIFRFAPLGTALNVTTNVGLGSDFSTSNPANSLFFRYSTNIAPQNVWNLVLDNVSVFTCINNTGSKANTWMKATFQRTGNLTYTATLIDIVANTTDLFSGSVNSNSLSLNLGGSVACTSSASSKYLDIDFISITLSN